MYEANPYRAILRREIPEPLIALLCFVLGIWLWDHYFGETAGYAPGTEQIALVKIDRDLQLAEAMSEDPPLLRWLAHGHTVEDAVENGVHSLRLLAEADALGPTGYHAYAALLATKEQAPIRQYLSQLSMPSEDPDSPTWWNTKLRTENFSFPENADTASLRSRAIMVGSIIWTLAIVGLAFLPMALRCLGEAFTTEPKGYSSAWSPSLGLTVFLVATLAWIGFTLMVELGVMTLPPLHPAVAIFLDSLVRILPTLIALALLFKKARHIPRSIGLNGHLHPPLIIGLFALLVFVDQPMRWALARFTTDDPTGGLSFADPGLFGLGFLLISACIIAPIAEEILYRGVLYRSLANKLGVLAAALVSSVIFSSLHFYDIYGLVSVATFGFVCALLYQSTGSLINVVALHMLYNASITLPEWTIYHAPM
ncbi:CPBP family intramembrane glutamic endopeptidase [Luteolibacter algae]|uniref:CPBP family intramembrane glutamic endopeptidase n=1 Tax=Luteolibacter algae TaxID=454151 RepID=A0ABW5D4U7_9BACT